MAQCYLWLRNAWHVSKHTHCLEAILGKKRGKSAINYWLATVKSDVLIAST